MQFLTRYEMSETEQKSRQAFLGLTDEDSARVRELREVFARHARDFAERFYRHLLSNPHTAKFLQDPVQLEDLKKKQAEYFARLLDGAFDPAYFEGRLRVGWAHHRIGLTPVWYLGAYNLYIQLTFPLFVRTFGNDLNAVLPRLLSLVKVIFLDIGLALDTYFQEATEQLRRRNDELQQALKLYWNSREREERLQKMASHEIRGGLAAIITSLEDLQESARGQLAAADFDQLEAVTRRCWSLSRLLGEMLTTPPSDGEPTLVDTAAIFEAMAARFALYAEGRAVRLQLPDNPPRVWADAAQLKEVFANLLSNAVYYLDKEPGRVEVTCRSDGDFYVFGVADNGPGIPESIRHRLFEPFVRGPTGDTRRREGSGLGLSFVRSAIEQGGGRVWAESTPSVGTRIFFSVPTGPRAAGEAAYPVPTGNSSAARSARDFDSGSPSRPSGN
jgi:signal transduction histidine kinase